jgi:eukaryotic-like serine/threonine-protein kinase
MDSPISTNSWIGRFVGDSQRYRLDKRLGEGGMGDVFLATDTRVGHLVALKLLKDTLVKSEEMRKRFEREIAICAALQSDHIVKISDCGVTDESFPFYVMEYLRGQTLRHLMLREKQASVDRIASIMTQICKGLQLAHQGVTMQRDGEKSTELIKVIHRDLKPDNIFLLPRDFGDWVKILDFGVAKILNPSNEQTEITNLTTRFIGTFRYSSPEQIQNDKNLDGRSDIYSLGIILYEMFSAADPFGLSIKYNHISDTSWLLAHSQQPAIPLRSQLGCEHLSVQLEAVVMKCLQKKPSDRFTTVEELDSALQAAAKSLIESPSFPGSNDETIPRPINQIEQPQSRRSSGSENETVPRPAQLERINKEATNAIPEPADGTTYQPKPTNVAPKPEPADGTTYQPKPTNAVPKPEPADGTTYQPKPTNTVPKPEPADGTTYQPKPTNVAPKPEPADGTTYQPKPTNAAPKPETRDGTTYQPKPTNAAPKPETRDGTTYQPKPTNTAPKPETRDGTTYQPKPKNWQQGNKWLRKINYILQLLRS